MRLKSYLAGWKTIIVSVLLFIVSAADIVGAIDLRALLLLFGVPSDKVGGAVALVSLIFLFLRSITTGPMFKARP